MACQPSRDESMAGFIPVTIRSLHIRSMIGGLTDRRPNIVPVFDSVVPGNHDECVAVGVRIDATECHDGDVAGAGTNALHQIVSNLDGMGESFVVESLRFDEGFDRMVARNSPKTVDSAD